MTCNLYENHNARITSFKINGLDLVEEDIINQHFFFIKSCFKNENVANNVLHEATYFLFVSLRIICFSKKRKKTLDGFFMYPSNHFIFKADVP